ncbi:MAG: hypothetical protein SAL70_20690 [Scytonema sp. PMC 1070.18]|nr:hypothetical protein [Scytonema sp. PMC 1070.18]
MLGGKTFVTISAIAPRMINFCICYLTFLSVEFNCTNKTLPQPGDRTSGFSQYCAFSSPLGEATVYTEVLKSLPGKIKALVGKVLS